MLLDATHPMALSLVDALHAGDRPRLMRLLQESPGLATARVVDDGGITRTALHLLTDWPGHFPNGPQMLGVLVAAGADVNARVEGPTPGGHRETPLHWAASSNDVPVLDALLDAGADIEAPGAVFTGGTAISDAVIFANWPAARRLLERGARTTPWQAAALGLLAPVQAWCTASDRPARQELANALWHAARAGERAVAEYLVGQGGDPHWVGHDGKTPAAAAREAGHEALAEWITSRPT